ncbi:DUF6879 family protein [Spirillospora sp. NPDC048911]|uniref:DUF6879 family protein n=1 Tax=Spirillospora sp. NPDC048911 TaxID=3364527 RepID=UPI00371D9F17
MAPDGLALQKFPFFLGAQIMARLSPEQFATQFDGLFTESTFRLEALDHYVASNEAEPFRLFQEGKRPDQAWRAPWMRFVRSVLASGRHMARVHVVTEPLTDYTRFELTCVYPSNVEAGEDVRILPRQQVIDLDLPAWDFWLLDSVRVAVMDYDVDGNWLGVELTEATETVQRSCKTRDALLARAVPLNTYLARIKQTPEETGNGRTHHRAS